MSKEDVLKEYRHRIPKNLDDVIKHHKDVLRLEHVDWLELRKLRMPFAITNLKGIFTKGFLYKSVGLKPIRTEAIFLVGHRIGANDTSAVHTSRIKAYDHQQEVFLTQSGSHYVVNEILEGEPEGIMLMHICNFLHQGGAGIDFGIPWFPSVENPRNR